MSEPRKERQPAFTDDDLMPFGKYINVRLEEVPASYLLWLWDERCKNLRVDNYISNSLHQLQMECPDKILSRKD